MGSVGSRVFGAWRIWGTESQVISASAAPNVTIIFVNLSLPKSDLDVIFTLIPSLSSLPLKALIDWTCLLMSLLRSWGRNFTSPSRTHKASTGWISASAVNELNWHYCHQSKAASCASDSGLNLPAVWRMKDSHTTFTVGLCWGARGGRTLNLEWRRCLIAPRVLKFTNQVFLLLDSLL